MDRSIKKNGEQVFGSKNSVPIDQTPSIEQNIDPATGFPLTSMQLIMRAQDLSDRRHLVESLQGFKEDFLPDDINDVDALKYAKPRLAQLPSELAEYAVDVAKSRNSEKIESIKSKETSELRKILAESMKKKEEPKSE